jgi:protease II
MNMKNTLYTTFVILFSIIFFSCEKDEHKPPTVVFKTGGSYTSSDATIAQNTSVTFGIKATKTEDELKTLNVSYAYDAATTTTTYSTITLSDAEEKGFEKDVVITTRSQTGTEKWIFTVTDKDGNMANVSATITVP